MQTQVDIVPKMVGSQSPTDLDPDPDLKKFQKSDPGRIPKSSLTELQPLQNVATVAPSPSTSSLPHSSSAATGLHTAASIICGGVIETFERLTTMSSAAATGDHNWADIEQFLLEENIKASSSVSPNNNDLTSPTADFPTSTTPLLHYNDNNLQYFELKKNTNGQKREELRSLDCSDVKNRCIIRVIKLKIVEIFWRFAPEIWLFNNQIRRFRGGKCKKFLTLRAESMNTYNIIYSYYLTRARTSSFRT
uniref:Uncharacterized protein n=1 Tax=Romanomermis culicivorax TaxID=13658 RepID=A0A915JWF3_ROMCU